MKSALNLLWDWPILRFCYKGVKVKEGESHGQIKYGTGLLMPELHVRTLILQYQHYFTIAIMLDCIVSK